MNKNNVCIITLGCSKNTVEAETVAGLFVKEGFKIISNVEEADIIVIHTCSFIQDAQKESKYQIQQAGLLKQKNKTLKIFVSGCLSQLLQEKIKKEYPFIDGYCGTGNFDEIVKLIQKNKFFFKTKVAGGVTNFKTRVLSTNLPSTYIKISEGCNHKCSYCIIPNIRGSFISRPIKAIVDEAKFLADSGIRELNIIAQDTTSYGIDIYQKPSLSKLIKEISKIEQFKWIRLLYAYPSTINKELLETIYEKENICKYIDIPIQHVSKNVLKNMRRPTNTRQIIESIKNSFPNIILRTSLIVGFPNETDADFKELVAFIKQNYFEHVGIFAYSDQKTAPSYKLKNKISKEIMEERLNILATEQFKNVIKNNKNKIGKTFEVLPEVVSGNKVYCRAYFQAPEIDNMIIVSKRDDISLGQFTNIKIKGYKDYDLIAK